MRCFLGVGGENVNNLLHFQVGECRDEETPWRPDSSGPLTEQQATEKARQIMRVRIHFYGSGGGELKTGFSNSNFVILMRYQDSGVEDCLSVVFASKIKSWLRRNLVTL